MGAISESPVLGTKPRIRAIRWLSNAVSAPDPLQAIRHQHVNVRCCRKPPFDRSVTARPLRAEFKTFAGQHLRRLCLLVRGPVSLGIANWRLHEVAGTAEYAGERHLLRSCKPASLLISISCNHVDPHERVGRAQLLRRFEPLTVYLQGGVDGLRREV